MADIEEAAREARAAVRGTMWSAVRVVVVLASIA
jgi:hypothetical protein